MKRVHWTNQDRKNLAGLVVGSMFCCRVGGIVAVPWWTMIVAIAAAAIWIIWNE